MPKLTIITVVRNDEKHIERTIKSVLNQTFTDYEYWIIDGASTDRTLDIVRKYEPHLKWLSEPDQGIYDAMNKGLRLATGDYVLFLNSGDELYKPDVLQKVFATAPDADVYYGNTVIVDEQGKVLGPRRLRPPEQLTWKSFKNGMLVSHQTFIPRRELCPPYDLRYRFSADFDWTIRILKQAKKVLNTRQTIVKFLYYGTTKRHLWASLAERYKIMVKYYGFLPTTIRHIWFALRTLTFYLRHRWY